MHSSKKTLIIRGYTLSEYIRNGQYMPFAFQEIIEL